MHLNVSSPDRIVRIVIGIVLAALVVTGIASGVLAIVSLVLAAVMFVTAIVGFCPLFAIFRISTRSSAR
jgi:hypothetical protein